jgi:mannosyltransferase
MNILLDNIIYSKERQGGVSNYFFEVTKYLQKFPDLNLKFYEEQLADLNGCRKELSIPDNQLIQHKNFKSLIMARLMPIQAKIEDSLLYHSSFYRPLVGSDDFVEVTTVYDFVHDYYASFLKKKIHNLLKYNAIKRSKGIICISNNTYSDMMKLCPPKKGQKVAVIHCGVSKDYMPLSALQINLYHNQVISNVEEGFLLFIGSRANYKNFDFVISLLKELPHIRLVVVGKSFDENENKWISKDLQERIIILSGVDNEGLNVLYNKALALVYPSDYEGFGIPVIEAMQAGCPVIAQNKSSIPEVAGDAGILFDKLNLNDFKLGVLSIANKDFRTELIEKGIKQSEKFSWEKCSKETLDFYKEVYV